MRQLARLLIFRSCACGWTTRIFDLWFRPAVNLIGYLVGMASGIFTTDRIDVIAYLFTVSKKEFSIAAAFVAASGLPSEIAIPAAFFAVIQMITSPIAAKILARGGQLSGKTAEKALNDKPTFQ